ncbi:MAG: bifunctional (p)ppGpp synthetase/guanosine-3',5'-bis(diphosphate) 3'-pyrophosphohydrolase [Chitinophagales bacterium]
MRYIQGVDMQPVVEKTIDLEAEKKMILKEYRALLRSLRKNVTPVEKKMIREAFELSMEAHKDMRRKSGEPYILHPIAVARIVSDEMGLDATSVVCALLHDVVEDTEVTLEEIERQFNKEVARIVDGLTKISGIFDLNSSLQAENFRKLLLTLNDDIRVILIKLADRLHNMRTLDSLKREKQLKIASETMYLYAPLAHRMGLYAMKTEMEDLSLKFTEPDTYKEIARKLNETKRERTKFIHDFIKPLKEELERRGFNFDIYGRPKSIYSIFNKIKNKGVPFEEIYDLFAIRIILKSDPDKEKSDCWGVYSAITDIYHPNPDRLRDWLSNPKANGYEALHTTVMSSMGKWVEIQIRTERMHEIAEKGFAAHWKYKEGSADNVLDEWLHKIRGVLSSDATALDVVNEFKYELFSDEIFVFTPKGDLKRLRKGGTALDFAFEIHSDIGKKCIGAKVNNKLVPLSHVLKNGDQIQILTSNKQVPNEDWLSYVVTAKARSVIKQTLKEEKKKTANDGREVLEKKMKQLKMDISEANVLLLMNYFKMISPTDLYYSVATKKFDVNELEKFEVIVGKIKLPKLANAQKLGAGDNIDEIVKQTLQKNAELLIMGESADKIDYKFAPCCNPIPGDDVFGFLTINDGIKIHRTNCPNAVQLMSKYAYRIIKTRWTKQHEIAFLTGIKLTGLDDVGLVNKITNIITGQMNLNMRSISFDSADGVFEGRIMVYVHDTAELEDLIHRMTSLDGILEVSRFDSEDAE